MHDHFTTNRSAINEMFTDQQPGRDDTSGCRIRLEAVVDDNPGLMTILA
jgi:hypothetical protein